MVVSEKEVILRAMEADQEFASYVHGQDVDTKDWRVVLDTETMPLAMVAVLIDSWDSYFAEKYPETDFEDEESLKELMHDVKRKYRDLQSLVKEHAKSKKLVKNKASSLPALSTKLKHIFREALGERCWLYSIDNHTGHTTPFIVRGVSYHPKDSRQDYAYVEIELAINSRNSTSKQTIQIGTDDFRENSKDALEILKAKGFTFETEELYAQYVKEYAEYKVKALWQNQQVVCNGNKYIHDNVYHKEHSSRGRYYRDKSQTTVISSEFGKSGELLPIPNDMTIYAFNLGTHNFVWLHSYNMELYIYNPDISKKLILPEEHKDLIDILLSDDIKELGSDIIVGKGAGTIILTKGGAGLGKTATSEIYSEKKHLPLYSVHSGQLSTDGSKLEEKLKEVFDRAERWGCILLLDEADVFIRERDNDVNHNAIVASFLRTMEYYNGTLFMTTNRENDVDEAIESRCIAILKYAKPDEEMRARLWHLFIGQYKIDTATEVIIEIASKMQDLSGRDIKNISMLVSRYMQGKGIKEATFDTFKTCATFRGKYTI